ncbi:MAG: hypothetical protein HGGPFJEG_00583 [Ignavibacteria bacterium]|nr:hypothetical protein [Ignavibacteria bacterium]
MAEFNLSDLLSPMLDAAKGELTKYWNDVKPYAQKEIKAMIENLKLIYKLKQQGKITEEQAKLYLNLQKNSFKIVLLTFQGLSILTVENTINAVLKSVKDTVNSVIGWKLI